MAGQSIMPNNITFLPPSSHTSGTLLGYRGYFGVGGNLMVGRTVMLHPISHERYRAHSEFRVKDTSQQIITQR